MSEFAIEDPEFLLMITNELQPAAETKPDDGFSLGGLELAEMVSKAKAKADGVCEVPKPE